MIKRYRYKTIYNVLRDFIFLWVIVILFSTCRKDKPSSIQAEYFTKFFGTSGKNIGYDIKQTGDGGYVLVGSSELPDRKTDLILIKTDKFGNKEWSKTFGDTLDDVGKSIQITSDGGFIILGTSTKNNNRTKMFLLRTDRMGNEIWDTLIGGNYNVEGNCVQITSDGGFILTGSTTEENPTNLNPPGMKDILMVKTDAAGNIKWSKSMGGSKDDAGNYILQKPDGGYIIIGSTESYSEAGQDKSNIFIVKTSDNGVTDWHTYGGLYDDSGECIRQLPDNSYIIIGTTSNADNTSNIYVAKIDKNDIRNIIWFKNIETGLGSSGKSIDGTSDNGYIITGTSTKNGSKDICLIKLLSDGNTDFIKYFGDAGGDEYGNSVMQASDGGYILTGTNSFSGPSMITVIKTNLKGEQK
ncbi:MAG: hypothetical protein HY958_10455 [Bacteroidia bacterium]|nr:hypothetical protein [Bacteroidia bacterium]